MTGRALDSRVLSSNPVALALQHSGCRVHSWVNQCESGNGITGLNMRKQARNMHQHGRTFQPGTSIYQPGISAYQPSGIQFQNEAHCQYNILATGVDLDTRWFSLRNEAGDVTYDPNARTEMAPTTKNSSPARIPAALAGESSETWSTSANACRIMRLPAEGAAWFSRAACVAGADPDAAAPEPPAAGGARA
jgi:hypothetical protein